MVPVYEFRHLTFQEYLAAQALVDENYPGRAPAEWEAKFLMNERAVNPHRLELHEWRYKIATLIASFYASAGPKKNLVVRAKSLRDEVRFGPIPRGLRELLGKLGEDGKGPSPAMGGRVTA